TCGIWETEDGAFELLLDSGNKPQICLDSASVLKAATSLLPTYISLKKRFGCPLPSSLHSVLANPNVVLVGVVLIVFFQPLANMLYRPQQTTEASCS
ncbi:unnamed protein product, partial [Heterosigma akashiwo]